MLLIFSDIASLDTQLFGRAGRGGMASLAHLFFYPKQANLSKDLESFTQSGDDCRRRLLLQCIGGVAKGAGRTGCCDTCSPLPSGRLDIFRSGSGQRKKRRRAVRFVDVVKLKERLVSAREEYLLKHPDFTMLGVGFVCPDSSIDKICEEAKYIASADNFPSDVQVRSDLKNIFFSIISSSSSS